MSAANALARFAFDLRELAVGFFVLNRLALVGRFLTLRQTDFELGPTALEIHFQRNARQTLFLDRALNFIEFGRFQ